MPAIMPAPPIPLRPNPYALLIEGLSARLRARRTKSLSGPMADVLHADLTSYLADRWMELSLTRQQAISTLPDRDQAVLTDALVRIRGLLTPVRPSGAGDTSRHRLLFTSLCQAAAHAGERLVAMRLCGQAEATVEVASAALGDIVQGLHLVGVAEQVAAMKGLPPGAIAPAFYAAVLVRQHPELDLTASAALDKYRLADGSRVAPADLLSSADLMQALFVHGEQRIGNTLPRYASAAQDAFRPVARALPDMAARQSSPAMRERIEAELAEPPRPRIQLNSLVAFASSALGATEESRVEGAYALVQSIVTAHAQRVAADGQPPVLREDLLDDALRSLMQLSSIVQSERQFHGDAEARWKQIEQEIKMLERQQKPPRRRDDGEETPAAKVVYPFPDEFQAMECRALYYQNAVAHGVPLGAVLAELYDSTHLTFGPTERQFFERLACYAARKYAANFAAQDDVRVRYAAAHERRQEDLRGILTGVEIALRQQEHRTDAELLTLGHTLLDQAVTAHDLRREEAAILVGRGDVVAHDDQHTVLEGSIVEGMVTRIRAMQEVRMLTALVAVYGRVPQEVIASYRDLPHVRRYAEQKAPEASLLNIVARNNQPMFELEQQTRTRWMRYRQQAPDGRDVKPVKLDRADDEHELDNPIRVRGQRPFQRKLPRINPLAETRDDDDFDDARTPKVRTRS